MLDYERIYREFIKDRRCKEASLIGYTESHHILPRSLGGGEETENLINLTPEDHYFAHLLLARIYGGMMWGAAWLLASNVRERKGLYHNRAMYGVARRNHADYMSTQKFRADPKFYEIRNIDGRVFLGRRVYLSVRTGLTSNAMKDLMTQQQNSYHGWYFPHLNKSGKVGRTGVSNGSFDKEVYRFVNIIDGREVVSRRHDFMKRHNLDPSHLSSVISGKSSHIKGWTLQGREVSRARIMNKAYSLKRGKDIISGSITELAESFCVKYHTMKWNIYKLRDDESYRYKGWSLVK